MLARGTARDVVGALALVAAVVAAAMFLSVGRAEASSCPSPGGDPIGFPGGSSNGDFVFRGRGFGHGVGMSQYGARGAAKLGCSADQIVTTYYTGTKIGSADTSRTIRVGIIPNAPASASSSTYFVNPVRRVDVRNVSSVSIPWRLDGVSEQPPNQPPSETWTVEVRDTGQYRLYRGSTELWRGSSSSPLRANLGSGRVARLPVNGVSYNRGRLEFERRSRSSGYRLFVTARIPTIEQYLYGLAEMPSSWDRQALGAQAIVGRSFAVVRRDASGNASNCLCHIYDSTAHQVYRGHNKETEGATGEWGRRWVDAVDASSGKVIRRSSDNALLSGNYASSHGGHSESSAFVWGGSHSHLQPIDDSRWERASDNPHMRWTARFTPRQLGRAFGVGTAIRVRLPSPRGTSGRIGDPSRGHGGMVVEGTQGTVRVSGAEARSVLGLRSALFRVTNPPIIPEGATPVTGDWDGNGVTNVGWFHDGRWWLRMSDGSTRTFVYGTRSGDVPVTGDWTGNGRYGVGIYRPSAGGEWHLRNSLSSSTGMTVRTFTYGTSSGDVPVTGDWNGNGRHGPGIFRAGGQWHLRNSLSSATGMTITTFTYGTRSSDLPVTGDWNRTGRYGPGISRLVNEWHLRNSLSSKSGETAQQFTWP